MEEEMITISKKLYDKLMRESKLLGCLEAAGVDNWDGYMVALDLFEEDDGHSS